LTNQKKNWDEADVYVSKSEKSGKKQNPYLNRTASSTASSATSSRLARYFGVHMVISITNVQMWHPIEEILL
jgi:hypothetical protein